MLKNESDQSQQKSDNPDQKSTPKKFPVVVKKVIAVMYPSSQSSKLSNKKRKSLLASMNRNITNLYFTCTYIVTNACMMIWSTFYHSYVGFILLIWANLIWARSKQREFMMKSSPYLVFYATCLLITNYIYNMNFTDQELPDQLKRLKMQPVGLVQTEELPGIPLLLKSLLMVTFWFTLRQMLQERDIMKHRKTLMFEENFQKMMKERKEKRSSGSFSYVISTCKEICVFGLMWIIIVVLFAMAVTGNLMNLFKITDMFFVLFFTLMFQFFFKTWMKLMNIFWSILIVYAMSALILVYAFQFEYFRNFPYNSEIGINKYGAAELFQKLLLFTLLIILTGLQMNHFQAIFQKRTDMSLDENAAEMEDGERVSG